MFGAVYVSLAKKNMKLGLGTLAVALVVLVLASFTTVKGALVNLFVVIMGMVVARIVYVSGRKNAEKSK